MPAPIIAAKVAPMEPFIIRPIRAGVRLTATADKAVSGCGPSRTGAKSWREKPQEAQESQGSPPSSRTQGPAPLPRETPPPQTLGPSLSGKQLPSVRILIWGPRGPLQRLCGKRTTAQTPNGH
uniref:Uncharacterized protein n=1 Tax=Pseudonaja textilis TaxID=8673 RepID=A0A670YUC7_PSETE